MDWTDNNTMKWLAMFSCLVTLVFGMGVGRGAAGGGERPERSVE